MSFRNRRRHRKFHVETRIRQTLKERTLPPRNVRSFFIYKLCFFHSIDTHADLQYEIFRIFFRHFVNQIFLVDIPRRHYPLLVHKA